MEKIPNYTSLTHKRIIRVLFRSPAESFVGCIFNVPALYTYRLEPTASFQRVVPSEYPKYFLIKDFISDLTLKKYHTDFFPSIGRFQSTRAWFLVSGSHFSNNISFSRFGLLKYLYRPEITITMANYAKQEKLRPENWHYTNLIKFAVVFDTFTEAWKSKVKLMKTAILYIYLLQYGYHFRLSQKTSANTSGQFADLSTGSSILKQISYNLRLPAKRMIKAVKIQTILSWNIPVGDKYLFLLAQRNLFYQIYPLHSEITQRISHKKIKQLINILLSYWEWAIWGWKTFPSNPSSISCS